MKVSINPLDVSFTPPSTGSVEHSPASGPTSDDENMHGIEVMPKKESTRKKDLKVFDFDLSGDEDDRSQVRSGLKKTKVNHKGSQQSKQAAASKKQTLLHQYMGLQSTSSSSSRGVSKKSNDKKDTRTAKSSDGATKKHVSTTQTVTDQNVRNTISKLLASKAEELAAKASSQEKQRDYASQEASTTTSAMSLDEAAAPVSEETGGSINRQIKRKNPLATTAAAAKRAPPKRARMEIEEDPDVVMLDSVSSQASVSSLQQPESSQTKQSGVKKNGFKGTLEKSEIALRTRSSKKSEGLDTRNQEPDQNAESVELMDDAELSDSQPSSMAEGEAYSPLCQDPELGLTDSPRSTVSSNSEVSRGGRPSPRYTARGRRMSNLSPDVKSERVASAVSGLGMGVRQTMAKLAGDRELESDPYSLDEDSTTMDKAYFKKQHLIPPVSTKFINYCMARNT